MKEEFLSPNGKGTFISVEQLLISRMSRAQWANMPLWKRANIRIFCFLFPAVIKLKIHD